MCSYISEKQQKGLRNWQGKAEEQQAVYYNRWRVRGEYGKGSLRGQRTSFSPRHGFRSWLRSSLERDIAELLTRPVGRPSHKPVVWYKGFLYQAASWKTARRVVAKVEFHCGELFPPSRIHRDQLGDAEPGGGAVL